MLLKVVRVAGRVRGAERKLQALKEGFEIIPLRPTREWARQIDRAQREYQQR